MYRESSGLDYLELPVLMQLPQRFYIPKATEICGSGFVQQDVVQRVRQLKGMEF